MLENKVEAYLTIGVIEAGGDTRKVEWIGRKHAPDRRVMHPKRCAFVELKRPGAKARPGQLREHERMRAMGEDVVVLSTLEEVDTFLETLK